QGNDYISCQIVERLVVPFQLVKVYEKDGFKSKPDFVRLHRFINGTNEGYIRLMGITSLQSLPMTSPSDGISLQTNTKCRRIRALRKGKVVFGWSGPLFYSVVSLKWAERYDLPIVILRIKAAKCILEPPYDDIGRSCALEVTGLGRKRHRKDG